MAQPQRPALKVALAAVQQYLAEQPHAILIATRDEGANAQHQMRLRNLIPSVAIPFPEPLARLWPLWVHLRQHKIFTDLLNRLPAPGRRLVPVFLHACQRGIRLNWLCPTNGVGWLAQRGKHSFRLVHRCPCVPRSLKSLLTSAHVCDWDSARLRPP